MVLGVLILKEWSRGEILYAQYGAPEVTNVNNRLPVESKIEVKKLNSSIFFFAMLLESSG